MKIKRGQHREKDQRTCASEGTRGARTFAHDLSIAYQKIVSLRPNSTNPRVHNEQQIQQIAKSIETFGFNVPVLVNQDLQVIAGHGRLAAAKFLKLKKIPTIQLEHLSEAQARAFVIADNKLAENSEWNNRLLGEQLKILSEVDLDFSLDVTGFEVGEIDLLIENLDSSPESEPEDLLPEPSPVQVSRPRDLWELGRHRLLCGNALSGNSYESLLDGEQANLVFTDPPYNVPIAGNVSGKGKNKHREFVMASGEMSEPEFTRFLSSTFDHLATYTVSGSIHFLCMDWRHIKELLRAAEGAYSELKNLCVWAKDNAGMGSFYRSEHEYVFVFKKGTASHRNNVQLGRFGRSRTNVWNYPCANSFSRASEEGNLLALHPTVKPVAMVADAIMDCSARNEIVLDPFLGSGTTLIASERTGRICCGLEFDPKYVDTAIRRWQAFTGQGARRLSDGRSFAECQESQNE